MTTLTAERCRELFEYDQDTGVLTWKIPYGRQMKGSVVGYIHPTGYRRVRVGTSEYRIHRIIFLWMTGHWPVNQVDHIDGDPLNNTWINLRDVTPTQNMHNMRLRASNRTGCPGVFFIESKNYYRVRIRVAGERYHVGYFKHLNDAIQAAVAFREKHHGEYSSNKRLGLTSDSVPSVH